MSFFQYRKPARAEHTTKDGLKTLRETLSRLNAECEETPRIADLKRILTERISEMEHKSV